MLESTDIFNLEQPHLTGSPLYVPEGCHSLPAISMPLETRNMLALTYADLESNLMDIDGSDIPILASPSVCFPGQPVMAVFGPNHDSLELFCRRIRMDYEEDPAEREPVVFCSRTLTYGKCTALENAELQTVKSTFHVKRHTRTLLNCQRILAVYTDGTMHIKISSQWPAHVRRSVARSLGLALENVIVYGGRIHAPEDQLLFQPSHAAVLAACAALKTGKVVEFVLPMTSTRPSMDFETVTVLDGQGNPIAQRSTVVSDVGAFPYFTDEYIRNLAAGCNPVYRIEGLEVNVTILSSEKTPGVFYGDLGYSMALAATEQHYCKLAQQTDILPAQWKAGHSGGVIQEIRSSDLAAYIEKAVTDCAQDSSFDRLYSVYAQPELRSAALTSILGYSRGIGIACGEGIQGLSNEYPLLGGFSGSVSLTEDGKVIVDGGLSAKKGIQDIMIEEILKILDVKRENIIFRDASTGNRSDMGPYTLSRAICFFPQAVENACLSIARDLEQGKIPPLSADTANIAQGRDSLFDSHTCAGVVVALGIDPVLLVPVVSKVWARLYTGRNYLLSRLESKARQQIAAAISDMFPCSENRFEIDIKIEENEELAPGSLTSLLNGITTAAALEAFRQATGTMTDTIPITAEDMIGLTGKTEAGE